MAWLMKSAFEPENSMKYMLDESETSEPPPAGRRSVHLTDLFCCASECGRHGDERRDRTEGEGAPRAPKGNFHVRSPLGSLAALMDRPG